MPRRMIGHSNTPSSSLSRERSLLKKETASRSSIPIHPPPSMVWGARSRPMPTSDLAGGLVWSGPTGLPLQLHRVAPDSRVRSRKVFPETSRDRARPFKRFCPPLTHSPHSHLSHPPSGFQCAANGHFQSLSEWQSGETHQAFFPYYLFLCRLRDRRHIRFSPTAYRPCTGHFSIQCISPRCQRLPFVVDDVTPSRPSRHPNTGMSSRLKLFSFLYRISFTNGSVYQWYRLGFSAQFGPATHFSLAANPLLRRGSPDSSKQHLKGFCATAGTILPPPQGRNRGSFSIGPRTRLFQSILSWAKEGWRSMTYSRPASSEPLPLQREVQDVDVEDLCHRFE